MSLTNARHVVLGSLTNTPAIPANTIRCKFSSGYTPTMGDSQTLVDAGENIWDIYRDSDNWNTLFSGNTNLLEVVGANTTGVTSMGGTFYGCTSLTSVSLFSTDRVESMFQMFSNCSNLTSVPTFSTASCTNMSTMLYRCTNVESGALALYQQASQQANPPTRYDYCFTNCGSNTVTGAAELAQIPASWGGTGA